MIGGGGDDTSRHCRRWGRRCVIAMTSGGADVRARWAWGRRLCGAIDRRWTYGRLGGGLRSRWRGGPAIPGASRRDQAPMPGVLLIGPALGSPGRVRRWCFIAEGIALRHEFGVRPRPPRNRRRGRLAAAAARAARRAVKGGRRLDRPRMISVAVLVSTGGRLRWDGWLFGSIDGWRYRFRGLPLKFPGPARRRRRRRIRPWG